MSRWKLFIPGLLCVLACQFSAAPAAEPFAATVAPTAAEVIKKPQSIQEAAQVFTAVPTANPADTATATIPPSETPTPSLTPSLTPFPTNTRRPTATLTLTPRPTSTAIASATFSGESDPNATEAPTWTPPPLADAPQIEDHLLMGRPIGAGGVDYIARTYPYGGTSGGRLQVHHGVDIQNPPGTPIIAAADGTVVFAGNDTTTMFGPYNIYYGNLVVIQHNFTSSEGLPVFSLYGHMQDVEAEVGQTVSQGDRIGTVGGSGIAQGPHLHFEVRVGDMFSFGATRNPELWIRPYRTFGTLAGRVTDTNGNLLYDATVQVRSAEMARYAYTYADDSVNGDPVLGENFALGDLPANYYEVSINVNGRVGFRQMIYIYPDRLTWIDIQVK
jgi:murein DD-endopeptidase MepM/ murein hydrolase activator NlpD